MKSTKKYSTAVILSGIFGVIGLHHFYLGRWKMGLLDFCLFLCTIFFYFTNHTLTAGILLVIDGIHTIVVTYLLLTGQYKDGKGDLIIFPGQKFN